MSKALLKVMQDPTIGFSDSSDEEIIRLEDAFGAHHYGRLQVVVREAKGSWITDINGRNYLDCLAAYSAANLGHHHPQIVDALIGALGQGGLVEFLNNSSGRDPVRVEDVLKDIERQLFYARWKILNTDISLILPDTLEKTLNPQIVANRVANNLFINSEQVNIKWNFQSSIENINHLYECYAVVLIGPRDS